MFNKKELYRAFSAHAPLERPFGDGAAVRRRAEEDSYLSEQLAVLRQRADEYGDSNAPALPYHLFRLYQDTGNRQIFETLYFERRGRLTTFSLLAWMYPEEERWLHLCEDSLWAVCSEPFWCIPAHFTDVDNQPLPFEDYEGELDLFASETGFCIAEVLSLLAGRLDERCEKQARRMVRARILEPFQNEKRIYKFECMDNNWSAVCGGAVGGTALLLAEGSTEQSSLVYRALSAMQVYIDSFGDDGISVEGIGYWTYGFGFFVCMADLLKQRTGGEIDLFADPKVGAISRAQQYYYISRSNTLSFSDGQQSSQFRTGLGCYLRRLYPDAALPRVEYAMNVLGDTCYRYCLSLRDFIWHDTALCGGIEGDCARYFPDAQWFIARKNGFGLAAKGGDNGESHNHNDCGSFIFYKQGTVLLDDFGAGLYDRFYFSDTRYDIFVNSARSHNVAIIAGELQKPGKSFASSELCDAIGPERAAFSLELSGCYGVPGLTSYRRELALEEGQAVVRDRFAFEHAQTVTEVFVSRGEIVLEPGRALLARDGVTAQLTFDEAAFAPEVLTETFADHHGAMQTAWLLHLTAREPAKEIAFDARLS